MERYRRSLGSEDNCLTAKHIPKSRVYGRPYTVVKVQWISSASGPHSHWPADSSLLKVLDYDGPVPKKRRPYGRDPPGGPNPNGAGVFCPAACFILRNFWALTVYSRLYPCCERRKSREARALFCQKFEVDRSVLKTILLLQLSSLAFEGVWK